MSLPFPRLAWFVLAAVTLLALGPGGARAARGPGLEFENRPVAEVRVAGLKQIREQFALNQVRLKKGDAFVQKVAEDDVVRLNHLGRFSSIKVRVEPLADGSVAVFYDVVEWPLLADVQVVGNKQISDQELLALVVLRSGDPADLSLIGTARERIKREYEKRGYYQVEVDVEREPLEESGILVLRVREGPLVTIRKVAFRGNKVFTTDQLQSRIRSQESSSLLGLGIIPLQKGELSRDKLETDAAGVREFYRDNGYLDAQVGRQIDTSPDQQDALVTFLIEEGRQYTVQSIRIEGNQVMGRGQILAAMLMKVGDVFSTAKQRKSQEAVTDLYGKLGYLDVVVRLDYTIPFRDRAAVVELVVSIQEGRAYTVGQVSVTGNAVTRESVVLHHVRGLQPGRRFDRAGIAATEQRLRTSPLFSGANVTLQGNPGDESRDVLIQVQEKNTGKVSFGAGVSSDLGVIGAIDLAQSNFDVTDVPESFGELISGNAFKGAGQYFSITLQPGTEYNQYSIRLRDPYLFESDFALDTSLYYWNRDRDEYDEQRFGTSVGVGHRFGDQWSIDARVQVEMVGIDSIDATAPRDVFDVEGDSLSPKFSVGLTRSATDHPLFPSRGSVTEVRLTQAVGDYTFAAVMLRYRQYWTLHEDFEGFKSVLGLRWDLGWLLPQDEAPLYDRLYAGGHRTLRGFEYRGVGPRGLHKAPDDTLTDQAVGGDFLFLLGLEYEMPIYQEVLRWVVFLDSGTVQDDIGLDQYRVSVGTGVRIRIPFLGQAPFALDLALPLLKQDTDETQLFSFSLDVPF